MTIYRKSEYFFRSFNIKTGAENKKKVVKEMIGRSQQEVSSKIGVLEELTNLFKTFFEELIFWKIDFFFKLTSPQISFKHLTESLGKLLLLSGRLERNPICRISFNGCFLITRDYSEQWW